MRIFLYTNMYIINLNIYVHTFIYTYIYKIKEVVFDVSVKKNSSLYDDDDDVYLEYYSGKGFHINYSCLHVLRKTHKLVQ
jgi:hypothetical protein